MSLEKIEQFKQRTKEMALRVIKLYQSLPKTDEAKVIGKQLLRSATSTAANYRAVCRARSDNERYSKWSIVVEEADETLFWLELLGEANIMKPERLTDLINECETILKIAAVSRKNTK